MRIAFLTQTLLTSSGWGRFSFELIERLRSRGVTTEVFTEEASGFPGEQALLSGAFRSRASLLRAVFRVRPFLKNCDIVHALDSYPYGLIGALGTLGRNIPLVISPIATHAILPLEQAKLRPFMRWTYRRAAHLAPITNYTLEEIKKRVTDLPPMERILLGVDDNAFQVGTVQSATVPTVPYFLSVGAVKKRKGYHLVLPALSLLKVRYPQCKYIIVGDRSDQSYEKFLRGQIALYGLESMVDIRGQVSEDELRALYQGCLAFVLIPENSPTYFAGFHLVYLEANALGKPVVGGAGYGAEEIIQDGVNGFLVPPHDAGATAAVLEKFLGDPLLSSGMAARCRSAAAALSWDKTVDQYEAVYRRVLAASTHR